MILLVNIHVQPDCINYVCLPDNNHVLHAGNAITRAAIGIIVGVVVGVIMVLITTIILVVIVMMKRKRTPIIEILPCKWYQC